MDGQTGRNHVTCAALQLGSPLAFAEPRRGLRARCAFDMVFAATAWMAGVAPWPGQQFFKKRQQQQARRTYHIRAAIRLRVKRRARQRVLCVVAVCGRCERMRMM